MRSYVSYQGREEHLFFEADYPLWLTRFQLSGIMDLLYAGKRRRVNRLTRIGMARPYIRSC